MMETNPLASYSFKCRQIEKNGELALPLSKEIWDRANEIQLRDTVDGAEPRLHTFVKALWNDWGLYLRFHCEDDHILATWKERDDPLSSEDAVEVFVSPDRQPERYFEFEFSPENIQFDAVVRNNLQGNVQVDTSWDCAGLKSEVEVNLDEGYTLYEIGIPFEELARSSGTQPQVGGGTSWLINLYRIDRAGNAEYTAWSPTGAVNFHRPLRFGEIIFY